MATTGSPFRLSVASKTNTPGTRGGSDFCDRTLAEKVEKVPKNHIFFKEKLSISFVFHISFSYAKIGGETKFQPLDFP